MLVVLEAAELLADRVAAEWSVGRGGPQARYADYRPSRRPSRLAAAVRRAVSRSLAAMRDNYERRELIRELSAQDDRLLADIGITRAQIPEVAKASFERRPQHATRLADSKAHVRSDAVAVEDVANDDAPKIAA